MESNLPSLKRDDFVTLKQATKLQKISLWMFIWISLRSYILQSGFNYSNFQGLGYANVIYPGLKRIYGAKTDALREALLQNIEFFNSNPQTLPLITSIHLTLLQSGASLNDARTIKMSLMGPLSGIGDSLTQFAFFPLFSIIAISLSADGTILGPIVFLLSINATLLALKLFMGVLGWKLGEAAINKLSAQLQTVIRISSMLGVTIITALAVRFVKIKFVLETQQRLDGGQGGANVQTISLEKILNNIMPYLASGIWIIFIYLMITKFKWSPYKVIIVTILVGVTLGVFGILGV